MDESFDELMGPPPIKSRAKPTADSSHVVSPDPSPTAAALTRSSSSMSGSGPPSTAFGHTNERWSQYERNGEELRRESAQANAAAVLQAANRAAEREPPSMPTTPYYDDPVQERLSKAEASFDPPERRDTARRGKAGMFTSMLSQSSQALAGGSRYEEETIQYEDNPHDRVRAEALKVLEMADAPSHLSGRRSSGYSDDPRASSRRKPAALAGLDLSAAANRPSRATNRFTIDDDDDLEDDMVDIINMESRANTTAAGGYKDNDNDESMGTTRSSTWSSRYSMDNHLRALNGMTNSDMLARMEEEQQRNYVSARNMFQTSPHEGDTSPTKIFGAGFTFRKKHVFDPASPPSDFNLQSHRTVWTDGRGTDWTPGSGGGHGLHPDLPSPSHHWQESLARKRTIRRRACLIAISSILAIIIVASVVGKKTGNGGGGSPVIGPPEFEDGSVTFYVTANGPYDGEEEKKLNGDLVALPDSGSAAGAFAVHLGNIQKAAVTMCPPARYHGVGVILRTSNLPVFIVPGEDDVNNCPNPDRALNNWKGRFVAFEQNWRHPFKVIRQLGQEQNFSFVYKGVLFVGLHLVGGRVDDPEAWSLRHSNNARWLDDQVRLFDQDEFRAIVMFGNARPSHLQNDFFSEALETIHRMNKPTIYVHSNSRDGDDFDLYKPFRNSNMLACEVTDGAKNRPLLINVGFGKDFDSFTVMNQ